MANPIHDMDFIEWWKMWGDDTEAKSHFLGYVRTGLVLRNQNITTPDGRSKRREEKPAAAVVKRGRKKKVQTECYAIRMHINANYFRDIIEAWRSLPTRLKSKVLIELWRHGRSTDHNPVLMLLPGGAVQPHATSVVIEQEIVATPVRTQEDDGVNDSLESDMKAIMEIFKSKENPTT